MNWVTDPGLRIFVHRDPIDMRGGFTKLQALALTAMRSEYYAGHLFLFLGRNPRRLKLVRFDGSGVMLIAKRLDRGSFMRATDLFDRAEITMTELARLMDGVNLRVAFATAPAGAQLQPHPHAERLVPNK